MSTGVNELVVVSNEINFVNVDQTPTNDTQHL